MSWGYSRLPTKKQEIQKRRGKKAGNRIPRKSCNQLTSIQKKSFSSPKTLSHTRSWGGNSYVLPNFSSSRPKKSWNQNTQKASQYLQWTSFSCQQLSLDNSLSRKSRDRELPIQAQFSYSPNQKRKNKEGPPPEKTHAFTKPKNVPSEFSSKPHQGRRERPKQKIPMFAKHPQTLTNTSPF